MQLHVAVNGTNVDAFALLQATEITRDSTQAISTAKLTFLAAPGGVDAKYDTAIYDTARYNYYPEQWDEVVITDGSGTRQFAGYITQVECKAAPGDPVSYDCICSDYGIILNTIIRTQTWTNTSDHDIIIQAFSGVSEITVTSGNIATLAANLATISAKDISLRALLEQVSNLTGGEWRVDCNRNLLYYAAGTYAAPWAVSDAPNGTTTRAVRVQSVRQDFSAGANRITVLGQMVSGSEVSATAQDVASQNKYCVRSATVVDRQLADVYAAQLRANAELSQRAWPTISGTYSYTDADGRAQLDVGQTQAVTNGRYGLNESYLIRTIRLKQISDTKTEFQVSFGQRIPDLVIKLRQVTKAAQPVTYTPPANIGAGQIVTSNFASTIEPVTLVTATPDANGLLQIAKVTSAVTNTYDSKLYRWDPAVSAYRHKVGSGEIEVDAVTAGTIAAGAIRASDAVFENGAIQNADIGDAQITEAKIGSLKVGGGGGKPGQLEIYSGAGSLVGFVGTSGGNDGGWFKTLSVGGTSYATGKLKADASGNLSITDAIFSLNLNGALTEITNQIVGSYAAGVKVSLVGTPNTFSALSPQRLLMRDAYGHDVIDVTASAGAIVLYYSDASSSNEVVQLGQTGSGGIGYGWIKINGYQVIGRRGSAVTAPSGGTTVDTQARTAINDLISRLQTHGLIS